jgi:hypothetical protein
MNGSNAFVPCERHPAHAIIYVRERVLGCIGQRAECGQVVTISGKSKRLFCEFISQLVAFAITSRRGDLDGEFRELVPEVAGTRYFFGMKRARSTFFCQLFRSGTRRSEVENKDLQPAQKLPDGFVVVSRTTILA